MSVLSKVTAFTIMSFRKVVLKLPIINSKLTFILGFSKYRTREEWKRINLNLLMPRGRKVTVPDPPAVSTVRPGTGSARG